MLRNAFWLLFAFAAAVVLALLLRHNHGSVSIFWPPYRIDLASNMVLVLAVIGCTSLPKRLWSRWEGGMAPAASDALRTVWMVLVLLVSVAFLVGDSYNPFLYFRF